MGKQGRRKQRQKRKQEEYRADDPTSQPSVNPSSAVHQLRHADPKIRQTALIALQANIIHQESSKLVSVVVLQAIREQVMDPNFDCASAAAECLALYLSYITNIEHQAVTTASWTPVLIMRMDQCLKAIQNDNKKWKQWYAVAAPCMKTLCKLVESNERALEYIMSSTSHMDTFLTTILGFLLVITKFERTTDIRFNEWVEEAAVYAARALHSSLDDNSDLAERVVAGSEHTSTETWAQLLSKLPTLSVLHICGSLVTMHQMIPSAWQSHLLAQHVLPALSRNLVVQPDQVLSIEQAFAEALALRKTQKEDEELEGEIVRKIQDRKEPARMIARRQKDIDRGSKASIEETKDGEQAMEEAIAAWSVIILPFQLTLEVTANLLSSFIQDKDDMDQDAAPMDAATFQALTTTGLAESLIKAMQTISSYQDRRGTVPKEHEALSEDLQDCISRTSACITNALLSQVLAPTSYEATWQVLQPHIKSVGVSSVLVALAQQGFPVSAQNTAGIQQLLQSPQEDCQRDGVCLLAIMMNNAQHPSQLVVEATQELLRVFSHGQNLAKIEALNVIMDLWGQDDYYPEIFANQHILPAFQGTLAALSTDKNLDSEGEEILFNASRFVDYKLGR
jgi:hypothetical protein